MDMKTLEWMGERVDRAREIIGTIEKLKEFAEYIEGRKEKILCIQAETSLSRHQINKNSINKESLVVISEIIAAGARKEIERLEQELAEL